MYLVDTNIFLEVLLKQDRSAVCKNFLNQNIGEIHLSDFTLHSIGVILFRHNHLQTFSKFLSDILPKTNLLTLPNPKYSTLIKIKSETGLDFDDSYQYCVCKHFNLSLVTMDLDFRKTKDLKVQFL